MQKTLQTIGLIGMVVAIIGAFIYTYNFSKNCDGYVVRGLVGLACVK